MKNKKKVVSSLSVAFALTLSGAIATGLTADAVEGKASATKTFDFTTMTSFDDVSMFSVGIDPEQSNAELGYTDADWVTYARDMDDIFTFENGLKVNTSVYTADACWNNRIYVRYNAETLQYFEATLTYSYDDTARFGWAGFMLGYTNYERQARWGDSPNGAEFFVQNDGKGTYSTSKVATEYNEGTTPANWTKNGEHTLTIVANESGIELKADGTVVQTFTAEQMAAVGYEMVDASVGFMLTNAQFTVKSFTVTDLTAVEEPTPEPAEKYDEVCDFTAATDFDAVNMFSAGIDPAANNDVYTSDGWVTYAKDMNDLFSLDNGLKVNTSVYSGNDVSENNIYVRYNKKNFTYFKAELTYTYDEASGNGWAGFILGYTNYERKARWGDSPYGAEFFVQNNGLGTYSGSKLNNSGYSEGTKPADWVASGEHVLTIVADENGIVFTADGTVVQTLTTAEMEAKGYVLSEGSVGFMFTNAQFTAKSFKISELAPATDDGDEGEEGGEVVEVYENNNDFTKLTSLDGLDNFTVGIDPVMASEDWMVHTKAMNEMFTLENGLKINTALYGGDNVTDNVTYFRVNEKMKYFKAEMTYNYDNVRNGWAGFFFGNTDTAYKTCWPNNPSGVEMFVQNQGLGTYSSNKLNGSSYTEGAIPEGWVKAGDHTLTIVVDENGIVFTADGTVVTTITNEQMAAVGYELVEGNVGLMFTNAQFTIKSFNYTNLTPATDDGDEGEEGGEVVVPDLEPQTYLENYDFTSATDFNAVNMFSVGIDPAANNDVYTSDSWVTYAKEMNEVFTLDNGLKVNTSVYSGNDVSENNIYVRYNKKDLQYFKAELTYVYDAESGNGWAGFILGYTNYARKARWNDSPNGIEMFVQRQGLGTYSSAKLNNSSYSEGTAPAGWVMGGEHTLTIIVVEDGITFYADGMEVMNISKETMQAKGYTIDTASIGFMFTNAGFTAKSFKVSPLNEKGEEYVAVESVEIQADSEVNQFEGLEINAVVLPENAGMKTIRYELPACAVESNGKIYFTKPGTYTVKAISMDNENAYDEFTVTVKENDSYMAYATTQDGVSFENYFVTSGGSKDGAPATMADYWTFNADGTMTLTEKVGTSVDSGYVLLYLKDIMNGALINSNSFEITYMVKSNNSPNGWHGVGFALTDKATVPNQAGVSAFIQEEATKATIWGSGAGGVGGPNEVGSSYTRNAWNMIKVRVYGEGSQTIEMYVNDMATPVITATAFDLAAANVALFTTTTITIGNVYFANLDANGNPVKVIYPESIEVNELPATAEVGDQVQITATVLPANASDTSLLYTTSDVLVATVGTNGMITFMGTGEVTITVMSKSNPAVYEEFTFTVTEKEVLPTSVKFDATPDKAEVGGKYTLFVTVLPEDATNYAVTFTSSNTDVATVDADGRLTYVGAGETVITVTCVADASITASFTLTVTAPSETPDNNSGSDVQDSTQASDTASDVQSSAAAGCFGSVAGMAMILPALVAVAVALTKKKED